MSPSGAAPGDTGCAGSSIAGCAELAAVRARSTRSAAEASRAVRFLLPLLFLLSVQLCLYLGEQCGREWALLCSAVPVAPGRRPLGMALLPVLGAASEEINSVSVTILFWLEFSVGRGMPGKQGETPSQRSPPTSPRARESGEGRSEPSLPPSGAGTRCPRPGPCGAGTVRDGERQQLLQLFSETLSNESHFSCPPRFGQKQSS